jgi:hypothetical protein
MRRRSRRPDHAPVTRALIYELVIAVLTLIVFGILALFGVL